MKVSHWYSQGVYPMDRMEREGLFSLSFAEPDEPTADRVLLMGISGVGKSTLLRGIAGAWAGLEGLLDGTDRGAPQGSEALLLEGLLEAPLLLCYAQEDAFWQQVQALHPAAAMIGRRGGVPVLPVELQAALQAKMADSLTRPNMLLLCEEPEREGDASLLRYTVTLPDVLRAVRTKGGMAQALEALGAKNPDRLAQLRTEMNTLLSGKTLEGQEHGYQVTTFRGRRHAPEALSGGERRIFWLLTAVAMALHPGGVLLVDEPESHIHPSQVLGLLSTLELLATASGGQLILSSHMPQVWHRYENVGYAVTLEEEA